MNSSSSQKTNEEEGGGGCCGGGGHHHHHHDDSTAATTSDWQTAFQQFTGHAGGDDPTLALAGLLGSDLLPPLVPGVRMMGGKDAKYKHRRRGSHHHHNKVRVLSSELMTDFASKLADRSIQISLMYVSINQSEKSSSTHH